MDAESTVHSGTGCRWRRTASVAAMLACLVLLLGLVLGCGSLRYYTQAAVGGAKILLERKPIDRLLERKDLDPELRGRLELVQQIRDYAVEALDLPDNGSYRSFVATGKQAAVWNVVAAPHYSLEPRQWCFVFAGCVSYRGYFKRDRAERYASKLTDDGWETRVGAVSAYSTLGWFADPVFDTVLGYPDWQLAGLLFHELAHQRVYVPGDTTFSESFASFVEEEGTRRWLVATGREETEGEQVRGALAEESHFNALMLRYRGCLKQAYSAEQDDAWKEQRKRDLFASLERDYRKERDAGEISKRYDGWFAQPLNNADLVSIGDYASLVPFFAALFEKSGGEFPAFFDAVEELAELSPEERRDRIATLTPEVLETASADCP